jgi:hypothetical protein
MKIGSILFHYSQTHRIKPERGTASGATGAKNRPAGADVSVWESMLRRMADMQAAMASRGEDDLRSRLLIDKLKGGRELAPDEMYYLRLHAPGEIEWIERIAAKRETFKQYMRLSPTRTDVRMMVLFSTHRTVRNKSAEQRLARARQFADAQSRYMQVPEQTRMVKPNEPSATRGGSYFSAADQQGREVNPYRSAISRFPAGIRRCSRA